MISEDYVSFEVAKLLKENGFDAYGDGSYNSGIEIYKEYSPYGKLNSCATSKPSKKAYPAPTLQMAMKWLRETHNLFVFPFPQMNANKFWVEIYQLSDNKEWESLYCESIDLKDYPLYEEACEEGIKYCLENLI